MLTWFSFFVCLRHGKETHFSTPLCKDIGPIYSTKMDLHLINFNKLNSPSKTSHLVEWESRPSNSESQIPLLSSHTLLSDNLNPLLQKVRFPRKAPMIHKHFSKLLIEHLETLFGFMMNIIWTLHLVGKFCYSGGILSKFDLLYTKEQSMKLFMLQLINQTYEIYVKISNWIRIRGFKIVLQIHITRKWNFILSEFWPLVIVQLESVMTWISHLDFLF